MNTTITDTPRVYVASLADYNAGRLHGAWIDLDETTDADDIQTAVNAMLAESTQPLAEEWAIHDYENFGEIRISEWATFTEVAEIAAGIAEHGDAYAACDDNRDPNQFRDQYEGEYDDLADYAYQYAEESGLGKQLDELNMTAHVDWESYGRDLCSDLTSADAPGGKIYVWNPNA